MDSVSRSMILVGGILVLFCIACNNEPATSHQGFQLQPDTVKVGKSRIDMFHALPNDSAEIVMLGDSHIHGFHWHEFFQNCKIINRGIGGDLSLGVLNRLDRVLASNPAKVFLQVGTNDIFHGFNPDTVLSNYHVILDRFNSESPNTLVHITSIIPTSLFVLNTEIPCFDRSKILNANLAALCNERNIPFINLSEDFERNGGLNPIYDVGDGLHLNPAGYTKFCERLSPYLRDK